MSPELEAALERARHHKMTPEELFEQRVSFVYGQQDHDKPLRSKDEIRADLIAMYGHPPCRRCEAAMQTQDAVETACIAFVGAFVIEARAKPDRFGELPEDEVGFYSGRVGEDDRDLLRRCMAEALKAAGLVK